MGRLVAAQQPVAGPPVAGWPPAGAGTPAVGRPFGAVLVTRGAVGDRYLVSFTFTPQRPLVAPRWAFACWRCNPLDTGGGPEFTDVGPLTVRAQLDVNDGIEWRAQRLVFPGGGFTATIEPGGTAWGEFPGAVGAGVQCRLTVWADPGASGRVPLSLTTNAADSGVGHVRGPSITEPTWGSPLAAQPQAAESTYAPIACVSRPVPGLARVGLLGDSITMGSGDLPTGWGFAVRAMDMLGLPWLSAAVGGDFLLNGHLMPHGLRRLQQVAGLEWVMEAWGTNNLNLAAQWFGSSDPQPVMDQKIRLWRTLAKAGWGVTTVTQVPVESGDSTLQGRLNSLRNGLVAWQRDGAPWNTSSGVAVAPGTQGANISRCLVLRPDGTIRTRPSGPQHPVTAIFDCAATIENPNVNGGNKWAAGMSADGVHPNTTGAQAMAQAIRGEVLRQMPRPYRGV